MKRVEDDFMSSRFIGGIHILTIKKNNVEGFEE